MQEKNKIGTKIWNALNPVFRIDGVNDVSEVRPPTDLLFISQVIHEYEESR
jgi:hypothetical protein